MTLFGRQPAFWIGLIVTIVLGVIRTLAGEGLISDAQQGQVENGLVAARQLLELLAPLIAGMLIKPAVTPVAEPVLPAGKVVTVEGTSDTVTIAPTPPGPTGQDAGAEPAG